MRLKRKVLAILIFSRSSVSLALSSMSSRANLVMPLITFIGVLISWLTLDRKSDLEALALAAASRALLSSSSCFLCCLKVSVTSTLVSMISVLVSSR